MTVLWTVEDLYEMGFFRNEAAQLISVAARLNMSPVLIGEFVMRERFNVWMSEDGDIQDELRKLAGVENLMGALRADWRGNGEN